MNVRRTLAAVTLALAVFAGPSVSAQAATNDVKIVNAKACKSEDSTRPCYWDAKKQGNKKGLSFYVMPKNSRGVFFTNGKRHVVKLPKGAIVFDRKGTTRDGYVRKATHTKAWTIVCPKRGGWVLEELNTKMFACN